MLTLKSIHDIERSDGLALGVLSVGDGIADDAFEEGLEDTTGLFVNHCGEVSNGSSIGEVDKAYWQRYA
jgi:hypothetical protein